MHDRRRFLQTGLTAALALGGWGLGLPADRRVRYEGVVAAQFAERVS